MKTITVTVSKVAGVNVDVNNEIEGVLDAINILSIALSALQQEMVRQSTIRIKNNIITPRDN